jgi:hypothetical protein
MPGKAIGNRPYCLRGHGFSYALFSSWKGAFAKCVNVNLIN